MTFIVLYFIVTYKTGMPQLKVHSFITPALDGSEWSTSRPWRQDKSPGTPTVWGYVAPSVGVDIYENGNFIAPAGI